MYQSSLKQNSKSYVFLSIFTVYRRFASRDCGFAVDESQLMMFPESVQIINLCGDPDIQEYLELSMEQNTLVKPDHWETASELYITLKGIAGL